MTEPTTPLITPEPDVKDWTWVTSRPCPDCGLDAGRIEPQQVGERVRADLGRWRSVLGRPDVRSRPSPTVWSPLEYAAHVRDVHRLFAARLATVLDRGARGEVAALPNWDQDATAIADRYDLQDPCVVAEELEDAARAIAAAFDAVVPAQHDLRAVRSNGSEFTVRTLAQYYLHDVVHHLWDVDGARA